ncbi:MAG: hypothetical protein IJ920_02715 [Paludibacteraceae bacterium]|nr:hypothetical protein [Paludibacteraceae bacterium]
MSKKSSTFAPGMRKEYHIPTIEITLLGAHLMQLPVGSGNEHINHAPMHREKAF